ncbi:hypothetical protein ACFPN2_15660 [Steroidobacter flavus]|uniref:Lipoprotein n=1 Tax=Steroidobacter flavus TaxID=1842136 RepID=A0ABV8SU92_9GAMM
MNKMVAVVVLACTVAGCGTMNNRLAPEKLDPATLASGSAIVVLSTGAADRCIATATMLNLAPAGARYGKDGIVGINVDAYVLKSDFPDHQGSLSAFTVQPGNYQLYPSVLNPYVSPKKVPKAEFSIAAGEVLYIGEFYMSFACSFENITEFRDQESRDLALLKTRNPSLAARPIVKRIAVMNGNVRLD